MQFDIQARGFTLTDGIRDYATNRLQFVLERNDSFVIRTNVRLADINGPRGGIDKRCQIELAVAGQNNILIEDTKADLYVAIDHASERCMRTLARRVERSKQHAHQVLTLESD